MTGANEMTTWPVDQLERIGAANEIRRPRIVGSVTGPDAHRVTLRLIPQPAEE